MLPDDVVALLAGGTRDGEWEPVFPLLTVDEDGFPRVCLLSRAELELDRGGLRCVLHSRHTTANLRRVPSGLLIIVHGVTAYYLRLTVRQVLREERKMAVRFAVEAVEEDSLRTPLQAMAFLASSRVRAVETVDVNRALFDRLDGSD
jgi:hypothetical protein